MIRVYITPLDDNGDFADEIDISSYVDMNSIGKIKRSLDNSAYDIGVFRYNNMSLKLHNSSGRFSEVGNLRSIFRTRRAGSKVRVTWAPDFAPICGVAVCGECVLSEEVDVYKGVLNDDATRMTVDDQIADFQVLSYESQLSKVMVPYGDLSGSDTLKDLLYKTLNQAEITKYLQVLESNLNLMVDYIPDDLTWFDLKTGKEAIEALLLVSNSVLYCEGDVLKVVGRMPSADIQKSFYGQASNMGNENIFQIENFRTGQNRILNVLRWKDGGMGAAVNYESVGRWGAFPKDLDVEFVTDNAKQSSSAASIVNEFKEPKRELELATILEPDALGLKFLDRVNIDYPTVWESSGKYFPVVGVTKIGDIESPLPHIMWDLRINQDRDFKIMGIEVDLKSEMITYNLREV